MRPSSRLSRAGRGVGRPAAASAAAPALPFSDSFSRSDGPLAAPYSTAVGSIVSGAVKVSATGAIHLASPAQVGLISASFSLPDASPVALRLRAADSNNCYQANYDRTGACGIYTVIGGAATQIATTIVATQTASSTPTLELSISGDFLILRCNNTVVASVHHTEPLLDSNTDAEIVLVSTSASFDNLFADAYDATTNMLANGSFEVDTDGNGLADLWKPYGDGSFFQIVAAVDPGHGAHAQRLDPSASNTAAIIQMVPVVAGTTYTLTSHYLIRTLNSGQYVWKIEWFQADGSTLVDYTYGFDNSSTTPQTSVLTAAAPAGTAYANITLSVEGGGQVDVDFASLV